ncbi:MAG: hypothetical protein ACREOW_15940 [Thermodesulfobacteriota bacterium]
MRNKQHFLYAVLVFVAVVLLPLQAAGFRLIQQTGGVGTYTSGAAIAPNANPSDDPNNPTLVTVRWRVREVPWVINGNGAGDGLTYAQTVDAVRGALAAW